ncbi:MAG TPA: hypothetical protein PLX79_02695 [Candidatus Dojkabacteria bacterium]|nr:hypothetical protein [Candidatus Dojkabacteria bacterium]
MVTNITDTSATITWTTTYKSTGSLIVNDSSQKTFLSFNQNARIYDDRDKIEIDKDSYSYKKLPRYTHSITIDNLSPSKDYHFSIFSGFLVLPSYSDLSFETFSTLEEISTPQPAYGIVTDEFGQLSEDSLVIFTISDDQDVVSQIYSYPLDGKRGWSIDLANIRLSDGTSKYPIYGNSELTVNAINSSYSSTSYSPIEDIQPTEQMILNNNSDQQQEILNLLPKVFSAQISDVDKTTAGKEDNSITCKPSCDNKECGSDGCGGTCGQCSSNQICDKTSSKCKTNTGISVTGTFNNNKCKENETQCKCNNIKSCVKNSDLNFDSHGNLDCDNWCADKNVINDQGDEEGVSQKRLKCTQDNKLSNVISGTIKECANGYVCRESKDLSKDDSCVRSNNPILALPVEQCGVYLNEDDCKRGDCVWNSVCTHEVFAKGFGVNISNYQSCSSFSQLECGKNNSDCEWATDENGIESCRDIPASLENCELFPEAICKTSNRCIYIPPTNEGVSNPYGRCINAISECNKFDLTRCSLDERCKWDTNYEKCISAKDDLPLPNEYETVEKPVCSSIKYKEICDKYSLLCEWTRVSDSSYRCNSKIVEEKECSEYSLEECSFDGTNGRCTTFYLPDNKNGYTNTCISINELPFNSSTQTGLCVGIGNKYVPVSQGPAIINNSNSYLSHSDDRDQFKDFTCAIDIAVTSVPLSEDIINDYFPDGCYTKWTTEGCTAFVTSEMNTVFELGHLDALSCGGQENDAYIGDCTNLITGNTGSISTEYHLHFGMAGVDKESCTVEKQKELFDSFPGGPFINCDRKPTLEPVTTSSLELSNNQLDKLFIKNTSSNEEVEELDSGVFSITSYDNIVKTLYVSPDDTIVFYKDLDNNGIMNGDDYYISNKIIKSMGYKIYKENTVAQYKLKVGWNLLHFPYVFEGDNSSKLSKASDLIYFANLQNADITSISTYLDGKFYSYSLREDEEGSIVPFGDDFSIIPGEAYFILNHREALIELVGKKVDGVLPVILNPGWNLIGIYNSNKEYYSGFEILNQLNSSGFTSDTLSKWDNGRYINIVKTGEEEYSYDYNVYPNYGYFVRVLSVTGDEFLPE